MKQIRLSRGSKVPVAGESWKEGITDDPDEITHWLADRYNVGTPLEENGLSAIDFDDKDAARVFWKEHSSLCTYANETKNGIHLLFSGPTKTRKFEHGDIKGNGYLVWPPSKVKDWTYRNIRQGELVPFPEHLFPIEEREVITREPEPDGVLRVRRAEEYGKQIFAVSGSSGHNNTFRFVCFMRDLGLTEGEAYLVLERWNDTNADPKWSPKEMTWKIKSSYRIKGA